MAEHRGGSGNFAEDKRKPQKQVVKAASIAVGTLKTTHNVHLKRVKKAARIATVADGIRQLILLLIFRKYILKYCTYDAGHRLA
ncbi:hypothetical protein SEEC0006_29944, partial [Salmonella enterica subsp. enterica serovar Choleraesuis str. 0006]